MFIPTHIPILANDIFVGMVFVYCLFLVNASLISGETLVQDSVVTGSTITGLHDSAAENSAFRQSETGKNDTLHTIALDKMVVTVSRRQRLLEVSQSYAVIKPDEWIGTTKSVADIVAQQAGVQTRRYGGIGSFQTVSIRGIQGSEVLVLLDGIPLNSAMGGAVDLGKFNNARLGEIEVYKGSTPGRFGGNSIGGVINLKTAVSTPGETGDIRGTLGSYGIEKWSTGFNSMISGGNTISGGLSVERSNNSYPYLDRNNTYYGTLINPTLDDTIRRVVNDHYSMQELYLHPQIGIAGGRRISALVSVSEAQKRLPAPEGKVNRTASYGVRHIDASMTLVDEGGEPLCFSPLVSYRSEKHSTTATKADQGFGASHGGLLDYFEYEFHEQTIIAQVSGRLRPFDNIEIVPTLITNLQDGKPFAVCNSGGIHGDWHSREASGTVALDARVSPGRFCLQATGSIKGIYGETEGGYDAWSTRTIPAMDTITMVWGGGGAVSLRPSETVLLYVNGGRFSNSPTLRERYGARGAQMPSPELVPETGLSAEIGIKFSPSLFYLEAACFANRIRNTIIMINDGYLIKPKNSGGSRVIGVEFMSTLGIGRSFDLEMQATLQNTKNLSRVNGWYGRRLPGEPDVTVTAGLELHPEKFNRCTLGYSATFNSYYYHLPACLDDSRVPALRSNGRSAYGRVTHSIMLSWNVTDKLQVTGSGSELTATMLPIYPAATEESGYSLILYPANIWCVSALLKF